MSKKEEMPPPKRKRPPRWGMQHGSPDTAANNLRWQVGRATASRTRQNRKGKMEVSLAPLRLPEL